MNFNRFIAFSVVVAGFFCTVLLNAQGRRVDPTFLHRNITALQEKTSALTTPTCHYKPLFGAGDSDTSVVVGIARYGEAIVDANGACAPGVNPEEDQVYVV